MTALLGIFVVLVELPCTGAPYFAILGLLSQGSYAQAIPLLLLYNFIFVLPLLIVIAIAYFGTTSEQLEAWRKKNRAFMRLAVGLFLIALGCYRKPLYVILIAGQGTDGHRLSLGTRAIHIYINVGLDESA